MTKEALSWYDSSYLWLLYTEELLENKLIIFEVIGIENEAYLNSSLWCLYTCLLLLFFCLGFKNNS